jgi:hypothetical protein
MRFYQFKVAGGLPEPRETTRADWKQLRKSKGIEIRQEGMSVEVSCSRFVLQSQGHASVFVSLLPSVMLSCIVKNVRSKRHFRWENSPTLAKTTGNGKTATISIVLHLLRT